MVERKNLGDILLEAGRVTQDDVEQALEHQRTHGGYFGQALVARGSVRREEVEWALATQFDLPLIFPDPGTVDPEVAALVPAEWSLANLAVPIVRAGDTLTVVVENPLDTDVMAELHQRTGLEIELALATPSRIRELVRALYGDAATDRAVDARSPVSLRELIGAALEGGAERLGVSARGHSAVGWYIAGGRAAGRPAGRRTRVRRRLAPGWRDALDAAVEPPPSGRAMEPGHGVARWSATLRCGDGVLEVDAQALAGDGGLEYVFRPLEPLRSAAALDAGATVPSSIGAELRVLGRTGVRVAFAAGEPALAASVLPRLPAVVWGDDVRTAHVALEKAPAGVFTLTPGSPTDPLLDALEACCFDVLSVDLPDDYPLERVLAASPIVVARIGEAGGGRRLDDLGIGWTLEVRTREQGDPEWELRAVRD